MDYHENPNHRVALTSISRQLICYLLCLFIAIPALAADQKSTVTLRVTNTPMVKVLEQVEAQSGYKFSYIYDEVQRYRVTCNINKASVADALKTILHGTAMTYTIKGRVITVSIDKRTAAKVNRANRNIRGTVLDTEGEPLIGAYVTLEGTEAGVVTDINGNFTIHVSGSDPVLAVSYVGMISQKIKVGNRGNLSITLQPNTNVMDEVVVTGYQEVKKDKMTGSVTTISSAKLDERYTTNVLDNLEGRVAGLSTYGGKPIIRGVGTLHGNTAPLLVVDGVPIEGAIEDLNPYDIQSVNVLKDAAAAAIYGARAANGIIVVTTKNATKKGKVDIDFSANLTVYENKNMDYADNFYMTPAQQVDTEAKYMEYYLTRDNALDNMKKSITEGSQVTPVYYDYYQFASGKISRQELDSRLAKYRTNNYARDFADNVYHTRLLQQYNLALRNSSDVSSNNLVVNYKHDNAELINNDLNWLTAYYKGSFELAKWLKATVSVNGLYSDQKSLGYNANYRGSFDPWTLPAYMPFYNEDGSIRKTYYWFTGNEYWDVPNGFHDLSTDPVSELKNNVKTNTRQNMRYMADLEFRIIKGLTANAMFSYEIDNVEEQTHANEKSLTSRVIRNAYTTVDAAGRVKYNTPENGGMLQTTNTKGKYYTLRGQLNYSNTFFKKHDVVAIAGLEFRETKLNGTKSLVLGYDEQLQNSSTHTVDFGTLGGREWRYNSSYMMEGRGYSAYQFVFQPYFENGMGIVVEQRHRYASGYANLTYTYDERYNIFGSYRKDYADVYGLNTKFRGKPLWSVGGGWNLHKESFMHDFTWLSFLKLRASYGVTGNIYQGASSYMVATTQGINPFTQLPLGTISSPANPNLRWEQARTTNIGVDFSLFNYRLRGNIDYYNKVSKDVFNNQMLDPSTGFASMFANVASMRNRGVEIALSYDWFKPSDRKDFSWSTSLTFTHNKNEVTKVQNAAKTATELIRTPFVSGYPASALWSYRFAGISSDTGREGMTTWFDEDGNPQRSVSRNTVDVLEYSGQTDPKVIVSMDNSLRWRGFSLSLLMAYYGGHKMRALCENETFDVPNTAIASYFLNAWTPENPTNTPGIGQYGSNMSSEETNYSNTSVHDADFLKIRNIVLGYDIPENWLRRFGINHCTFRFQINNPKAIWTKNNLGVDPETLGIRTPSSYVFGLNINI